ncbi:MAG: hypothetical protein PHS83_04880 [Clostridia bacterium]|jgi:hypothetical protein|nr:hypothetical protein [Clostridia bacterium]MDD4146410.1 hypothetical protein [Clostridia bacterium]MDD4665745.1 hypothetical protein [Clostridia bacterium]
MSYWGAGFLAAGAAWVLNRFVVKYLGESSIIWVIPWLEEIVKTGTAVYSGASLLGTHVVFGVIEAVADYAVSPRWGILAGFSGMLSHWFYGLVTVFVYKQTSSWLGGILCAGFLHVFWNYAMTRINNKS